MKLYFFFVAIQILIIWCTLCVKSDNDSNGIDENFLNSFQYTGYDSIQCKKDELCWKQILNIFKNDKTSYFLDKSTKMEIFKKILKETKDSPIIDQLDQVYFVYALFDPYMILKVLESFPTNIKEDELLSNIYNEVNLPQIINSFVYIGSGTFDRLEDHLYHSKAQCPDKDNTFMHAYVSPVTMYICSKAYEPLKNTDGQRKFTGEVFLYPLIAVRTKEAANLIEEALIQLLKNTLINIDDHPSNSNIGDNVHFLAHFVIEYMLRFMPYELANSKYLLQNVPIFNFDSMFSYGFFETDNGHNTKPQKLAFQNNFFYIIKNFEIKMNYKDKNDVLKVSSVTHFPFEDDAKKNKYDFIIKNGNEKNKIVKMFDDLVKKFTSKIANDIYECFDSGKPEVIKNSNIKSLQNLVEHLSSSLEICTYYSKSLNEGNGFKSITTTDYIAYLERMNIQRKILISFEFKLLTALYLNNPQFYIDWDSETKKNSLDNKLPANFEEQVHKTIELSEIDEIIDENDESELDNEEQEIDDDDEDLDF